MNLQTRALLILISDMALTCVATPGKYFKSANTSELWLPKKKKKRYFQKGKVFFGTGEAHKNDKSAVSRAAGSLAGEPHAPTLGRRGQAPAPRARPSRSREPGAAEARRAPSSLRAPQAVLIGCSYAGLPSSTPSEGSLPLPLRAPSPNSAPPPAPCARLLFLAAEFGPSSRRGDSPATDAGRPDWHP